MNGFGTRIASSSAKCMALRVCLDTLRVGSSSAGSVGESMVERRRVSLKSEPRRNSLLVGVCDDEDGEEEEEEENKMAAWMGVSLQRGLGVRRRRKGAAVIENGMAGNGGGLAQRRTRGVNSSMSMSRVFSVLLTTSVSAV